MSFGISNNVRSRAVRTCTPELFWKAVRSDYVARVCAGIADAWEQWKRGELSREEYEEVKNREKLRLPAFTFHATFTGGRRLNAEAVSSGLCLYDIDHLEAPREYFAHVVEERVRELGIVLAHVTPSKEGLRFVFVIPAGMSLAEAQEWMSRQLNDPNYDRSVKDLARSSFAVPEEYFLYIDEEGLFNEKLTMKNEKREVTGEAARNEVTHFSSSGEEEYPKGEVVAASRNATDTQGNIASVAAATTPAVGHPSSPEEGNLDTSRVNQNLNTSRVNQNTDTSPSNQPTFKGIPYSEIIRQWFILSGGEPAQGERNTKLHRLAYHLRHITDNDEKLLLRIMPRFGLSEEEMKGLIHSACTATWCGMPRMMQEAINNGELGIKNGEMGMNQPPAMPEKLPPLIELLVSQTPDIYKPAVAHAVFPSLATHLHRVKFRYIDNVEHEATLMNVLMAGTGAGKDCITEPINRIMADIRERDAKNLERERQWKQEINSKGANKDKRQRPEGLIIQEIDADMTNPAFVMRTAEADGHFLYTKLNEIDQFDALKGSGKGNQQFQIMCLAFDPGNRYGQTRVGAQSVTEKVTIRFNWNASTTIQKGKRYFNRVLTDGPISRINFCTIPEREIGAEMPVYGTYEKTFDEELKPYIERLVRATGTVDCPEAFALAQKMCEENAEFARVSQSRVFENLSFRANVIAYLKACVLYVAGGEQWDKTLENFVRWSLQYDMWCKMEFFGEAIEQADRDELKRKNGNGPSNMLLSLPDEFTRADAERMRQLHGMDRKGTGNMLRVWVYRRYITVITDNNYRKLKYRSDGIDLAPNQEA